MPEAPNLIPLLISALTGIVTAVVAATITASLKRRELDRQFEFKSLELTQQLENRKQEIAAQFQQQFQAENERARLRFWIECVRPLAESAADLRTKLTGVEQRVRANDPFMITSLREMKERSEGVGDVQAFLASCAGGWHHYAATTLYDTAIYFARARKVRNPSRPVVSGLVDVDAAMQAVRSAFGGEHGIWLESQDNIADLVMPDGTAINFRDFLLKLVDQTEHKWFLRLLDFYFHVGSPDALQILATVTVALGVLETATRTALEPAPA